MTSKLTITRERMEEIILDNSASLEEFMAITRMALSAMDSEPVIIVGDDGGDALAYRRLIQSFAPGTKLYLHAQSAPVVPDERDKTVDADDHPLLWSFNEGWSACRAAMLQHQPQNAQQNIPENIPGGLVEAVNNLLNNDGSRGCYDAMECGAAREKIELWLAQRQRWEEQRKANLSAGNSPVIPDGLASMLRRWLVFGRGMQNAGSQLPHNLIAETEEMLAAADCSIPMISDRWVPVSERMPDENAERQVLACFKGGDISTLYYFEGRWDDAYGIVPIRQDVTHWMPLPVAPQEGKP